MQHQTDSANSMAKAVTDVIGGRWALNFHTYLDEDAGFIYFSAPAAANIRTVGSLQLAVANIRGVDGKIGNLNSVSNRQQCLIGNPKSVGLDVFDRMLDDESVVKFTFIRDPAERFAIAYRNLFSINTMQSEPRVKLFEFLNVPIESNLSMLDLAEFMCEEAALKQLLPPLRPQRQVTAFDIVDYNFIGRHEKWERDYPAISSDIFGCDMPVFDPVTSLNVDPEGTKLRANVDEETRAALEEAYAEDYEMIVEIEELFPDGFAAD